MFKLIVKLWETPVSVLNVVSNDEIGVEVIHDEGVWDRMKKRLYLFGRLYDDGDEVNLARQVGTALDDGLDIDKIDEHGIKSSATFPSVGLLVFRHSALHLVPWRPMSRDAIEASLGI